MKKTKHMTYVTSRKEENSKETLLLVNKTHPLCGVGEMDLVPVDPHFPDILLQREAADALKGLLLHIGAGNSIVPVSGYRSNREQREIYQVSLRENGADFTGKYVALPGCSEHETGLAIDLGLNRGEIDFIRPHFPYQGICGRFRSAAPDYGFIERYPQKKEGITGIAHEPWHFLYVGCPHARIITDLGMALEEYVEERNKDAGNEKLRGN